MAKRSNRKNRHNKEDQRYPVSFPSQEQKDAFSPFVAPVISFQGEIGLKKIVAICSIVLVRIKDRFFGLTAGHAIRDSTATRLISIDNEVHTCPFNPIRGNVTTVEDGDAGYWEISARDAATFEEKNYRRFASED